MERHRHPPQPERTPSLAEALSAWPHTRTRLIGREREVEELREIVGPGGVRLVTLVGPGGVGKTRLALELAADIGPGFEDGTHLVSLAPVSTPSNVLSAIAQAVRLPDATGSSLAGRLHAYLRARNLLVLLDNFEHVNAAAGAVGELIGGCPRITVLVTSRAPLGIYGEREYPVVPLACPELDGKPDLDEVMQSPAVQLFAERALAVTPGFSVTPENAATVGRICTQLDGLPLAIELAGARTRLFHLEGLLGRLDHRLGLLSGGAHDLPARQRALRNTIDWSYDLLSDGERRLLRRLSVFAGGFTFEAAEAVGDEAGPAGEPEEGAFIGDLTALVHQSLLRQADARGAESRFMLLETIREYGLERLVESGESADVHRRHAMLFSEVVQRLAPKLRGPDQTRWLQLLDRDYDNLRAALTWSRAAAGAGIQSAATLTKLASGLCWYWYSRGHFTEGRHWIGEALAYTADEQDAATLRERAELLFGAGALAGRQNDFAAATEQLGRSLALWRRVGDERGLAYSLCFLGFASVGSGEIALGRRHLEEAVSLFSALEDSWGLAYALNPAGRAALFDGDPGAARSHFERSLALYREMDDRWGLALTLGNLGDLAMERGDFRAARAALEEALAASEDARDGWLRAVSLCLLGDIARHDGAWKRAEELYLGSLALQWEISSTMVTARCATGLAQVACSRGRFDLAARLLAATGSSGDASPFPVNRQEAERLQAELRDRLGDAAFEVTRPGGEPMSPNGIAALVSSAFDLQDGLETIPAADSHALTAREQEVVAMLAHGQSNRDIARELVISERTAEHHVASILQKLGVHSRGQAAAWAMARRESAASTARDPIVPGT